MKVTKVLRYMNGRTADGQPQTQMKVIVKEEKVLGSVNFDKSQLVELLADVEEPTAAMLVSLTDGYLARGEIEQAAQAALTAIKLAAGEREPLLTLTVILFKANMMNLSKKAFSAVDEGVLSQIDDFTVEPAKPGSEKGSQRFRGLFGRKR